MPQSTSSKKEDDSYKGKERYSKLRRGLAGTDGEVGGWKVAKFGQEKCLEYTRRVSGKKDLQEPGGS